MASKFPKPNKKKPLTRRLTEKSCVNSTLEKNREKTLEIAATSIPSYFNRHFRGIQPPTVPSTNSLNRFFSPQPLKPSPLTDQKTEEPPKVIQDPFMSLLLSSNGIELYKVYEPNYKYFISPGNNDPLIKKILRSKSGWSKSFSPHSANLIWTEVRKSSIFDLVPKGQTTKKTLSNTEAFTTTSPILPETQFRPLTTTSTLNPLKIKIYNKLEGNSELS